MSRQRAWGVPIAVFVKKGEHEPLIDERVNARIAEAFEQEGADAWYAEGAARRFLAPDYDPADYEKVDDILDVWFDSGSTHAYVLEDPVAFPRPRRHPSQGRRRRRRGDVSGRLRPASRLVPIVPARELRHARPRAVRRRADARLHARRRRAGKCRSRSATRPSRRTSSSSPAPTSCGYGRRASITPTISAIGPEILKTVSDNYRKLRNTIRWMLGTLAHYAPGDAVRLCRDGRTRAIDAAPAWPNSTRPSARPTPSFDYARVVAALSAFMNADLSAFYFDIRKDALYCEPPSSAKRRGALEAIDHIFRAVTVWLAPILVFTSEETWAARDPNARSVHLEQFPTIPEAWRDDALAAKWETIRRIRSVVTGAIEIARANKEIGSSLEAHPDRIHRRRRAGGRARGRRFRGSLHHLGPHAGDRRDRAVGARSARTTHRASRSSSSGPRGSNARAPGAISIRRPPIRTIPTSPRATPRRCANSRGCGPLDAGAHPGRRHVGRGVRARPGLANSPFSTASSRPDSRRGS